MADKEIPGGVGDMPEQGLQNTRDQTSFAEALFAETGEATDRETLSASGEAEKTEDQPDEKEAVTLDRALLPVFRVALVREAEIAMEDRFQVTTPQSAADFLSDYLKDQDREYFVLLLLDTKNRLIGLNVVSVGILDSALVHPREVFKSAILCNAASVLVAHNHPSGDPTPSPEDRRVTQRLKEAGELLGIEVLDHIILGEQGKFVSLKERGEM